MQMAASIYVAGAGTLVGAAIRRALQRQGYRNLVGGPAEEPECSDAHQVEAFFAHTSPEYVFLAAGKSGGIGANQRFPADLLLDNLLVACHVIRSAYAHGVKKLLYLASSCSYPKHCPQPMRVQSLLTGPLEPTNKAYAIAKLAGIALCQAYRQQYGAPFISGIPANPFGPGDDFSPENAHVIGALMHKMHDAKVRGLRTVEVWGTGAVRREFIFADDLAEACICVMRSYDGQEPINLGSGMDQSIRELAACLAEVVGFDGELRFDASKPDGIPQKILDSSCLRALGWRPKTPFRAALAATYAWFRQAEAKGGSHVHTPLYGGSPRDLP